MRRSPRSPPQPPPRPGTGPLGSPAWTSPTARPATPPRDAYPAFQAYLRQHRPPVLIVWGRHDEVFGPAGAEAYLRDVPDAELHLLDTGHFALEEDGPLIATTIRDFLTRRLP
jgi:pimeloyl-ACP methyl ester carboxylesterase